jgi:hypothetical protein
MNVRTIFRYRFTGRYRPVYWLRPLDGVWRLRDVWLRWLFVHADSAATTLPEDGCC